MSDHPIESNNNARHPVWHGVKRSSLFTGKIFLYGLVISGVGSLFGYFILVHLNSIQDVQNWMQHAAIYFFLIRLLLMGTVIYVYPYYMRYLQRKNLQKLRPQGKPSLSSTEREARQWLQSRWFITSILICLELITHLDQIGQIFH